MDIVRAEHPALDGAPKQDACPLDAEISAGARSAEVSIAIVDAPEEKPAPETSHHQYVQQTHTVFFHSASDPMVATDAVGRITELNREAEKLFGYSRQELIGEAIEKLVPERFRKGYRRLHQVSQADPKFRPMNRGYAMFALRRDGTEVPLAITLSPVPVGNGWVIYSVARQLSRLTNANSVAKRLHFEQALAGLSAKFINLPPSQVDQEIDAGLRVLADALHADRITLARTEKETGYFVVTHAYAHPGIPLFPKRVLKGVLPWLESKVMSGQIICAEKPEDLPPEAHHELEYMKSVGEKSAIVVPFRVSGKILGAMSIDSFRQFMRWDNAIISRVQDVADILANALARKQADEQLQSAYSEIQRLKHQLETENSYLREEIGLAFNHSTVVGSSGPIRDVLKKAEQVAHTDSVVIILGETGTGKELIARTIHEMSERRVRPMVKVNCAALPTSLIESELFGREKGAYTGALAREIGRFELADKSTIFLDEIGELPLEVQSKLLRVLQEGEFERLGSSKTISIDARVITATSRNLQAMVEQGKFREDLYYRLNVFPIAIPPLRERVEDIPALVWHLLKDLGRRMGRQIEGVHAATMQEFQNYRWPGNVRELRNVIERNLILNTGTVFRAKIPELEPGLRSPRRLDEVETEHLRAVLQSTRWRIRGQGGAAEIIGLKPTTLEARMKKLGIHRP